MTIEKYTEWYIENSKLPEAPMYAEIEWLAKLHDLCDNSEPCDCMFYTIHKYRIPDNVWCVDCLGEKPEKGTEFWIPKKMPLNIYKVERFDKHTWDQYSDFVVVCEDENTARKIHPNGISIVDTEKMDWTNKNQMHIKGECGFPVQIPHSYTWIKPRDFDKLIVSKIGVASKGVKKGIITSSFHAG